MICGRCGGRIRYAGQDESNGAYDWYVCTLCGNSFCELDYEYNYLGEARLHKRKFLKKKWFVL